MESSPTVLSFSAFLMMNIALAIGFCPLLKGTVMSANPFLSGPTRRRFYEPFFRTNPLVHELEEFFVLSTELAGFGLAAVGPMLGIIGLSFDIR